MAAEEHPAGHSCWGTARTDPHNSRLCRLRPSKAKSQVLLKLLIYAAIKGKLYLRGLRDQMPVGRINHFQAS